MSRRVLVVGPAWVGDMVLSQSLYKTLQQKSPDIEIHVAAPEWSQALLHRMPEVSAVIDLPFKHGEFNIADRYRLAVRLRDHSYDQAIVVPRSLKSALMPWFASIPLRTGYRGEMRYGLLNDIRPLDVEALPRTVDRLVYLGEARGTAPVKTEVVPALTVSDDNRSRCLERLVVHTETPILSLLPGAAFGKSKQWPPTYFAELAHRYIQRGFQVWIFGSQTDVAASREIIQALGKRQPIVDLCGKTSLDDAVDLLSLSRLVISNDSGLMHVAAAVGCPLVAIYGATSPTYTPPLTYACSIIYRGIECSPCWERKCRYGHYHCLTGITSADVLREADRLLSYHE